MICFSRWSTNPISDSYLPHFAFRFGWIRLDLRWLSIGETGMVAIGEVGVVSIGEVGVVEVGMVDTVGCIWIGPMLSWLLPYACCSFWCDMHG